MGILARTVFREAAARALLGTLLFTFVLFLQQLGKLFEMLVRSSASPQDVATLIALVLPLVLVFTVPVGVLVGVLIALSRMSADGEITAMRAAGIAGRRLIGPVLAVALIGLAVTAAAGLWLTPWSIRQTYVILNRIAAAQLTAEIQPRVFEEQFPQAVLYVGDVVTETPARWRKVFLVDLAEPRARKTGAREQGEGLRITIASEAVAVPDPASGTLQLSMKNGSSYEAGANPEEYFSSRFPQGDQVLEARKRDELRARTYSAMDTVPLYRAQAESVEARIELHKRLTLPFACVLLALLGVSLGISSRKGGKSAAFVTTVLIAFLYWMGFVSLIGLARQGTLDAWLALWTPNIVFAAAALIMLVRMEHPGDRDLMGYTRNLLVAAWRRMSGTIALAATKRNGRSGRRRWHLAPLIVDTYVLQSFLYHCVIWLASFVLMTHVYTFFELLGDIIRNNTAMKRVAVYLFFLTPKLIYDAAPMSILVATLVTFGVMSKNNEVTAFKASGVSLQRLALPVLLAGGIFSVALFAFDHYYVADANIVQDAIRNEIKNRPVQTYLRPDRKWVFGKESRIYYYTYFEPAERIMVNVRVFGLAEEPFRLTRHISAEKARWEPFLNTWVFQNGWVREINGTRVTKHEKFQAATFPELVEPPDYFLKEVRQEKQMTFAELERYIRELTQSGLDTVKLRVQYHKKFSVPLFALIMAVVAVPFAFLTGSRGAIAGVGVSFVVAIAYYAVGRLFEEIGNVNQLPAAVAAWSPDVLFGLTGLYLLARLRS